MHVNVINFSLAQYVEQGHYWNSYKVQKLPDETHAYKEEPLNVETLRNRRFTIECFKVVKTHLVINPKWRENIQSVVAAL